MLACELSNSNLTNTSLSQWLLLLCRRPVCLHKCWWQALLCCSGQERKLGSRHSTVSRTHALVMTGSGRQYLGLALQTWLALLQRKECQLSSGSSSERVRGLSVRVGRTSACVKSSGPVCCNAWTQTSRQSPGTWPAVSGCHTVHSRAGVGWSGSHTSNTPNCGHEPRQLGWL